jgi:hypothetical protein
MTDLPPNYAELARLCADRFCDRHNFHRMAGAFASEHRRLRPRTVADLRKALAWISDRKAPDQRQPRIWDWEIVFEEIAGMAIAAVEAAREQEALTDATSTESTDAGGGSGAAAMTTVISEGPSIRELLCERARLWKACEAAYRADDEDGFDRIVETTARAARAIERKIISMTATDKPTLIAMTKLLTDEHFDFARHSAPLLTAIRRGIKATERAEVMREQTLYGPSPAAG